MNDLDRLSNAIMAMHGCECSHVATSTVVEAMDGMPVWRGTVETFALAGHPRAKRAYAWHYQDDDDRTQYVAVLELPPVQTPRDAVQVAIAAQVRHHI